MLLQDAGQKASERGNNAEIRQCAAGRSAACMVLEAALQKALAMAHTSMATELKSTYC